MEWNEQERNLLNALVLYVQAEKPPGALQPSTLRELITGDLSNMDQNFENLKPGHPANEPYKRFKRLNYISRIHIVLELRKRLDLLIKNHRRNYGGDKK